MHIHMYACIILCNVLYIIYCILCIYIYISYIAHISCIYRVYMEKIILSHLNCRVLPITSQVSSEYPHPQWIWSHLLPLWCASSRGQSSSLRSSTKPPWLWTRNHQKTYVRAIWVCIYIYVHTLPGTSTKISCAFSTRTTGDSGRYPKNKWCSDALVAVLVAQHSSQAPDPSLSLCQFRFGSNFPEEARNITMLTKCCINSLPFCKKTF